ncbi:cell division protein SepF [Candidatus Woesearchaeota archaeon]|nr:cell division protein SepF [Candidatus Woesearchaeota archaeon]
MGFFSRIKETILGSDEEDEMEGEGEYVDDYVQLDSTEQKADKSKLVVRPYVLDDFSDVKEILDAIRTGKTIALINIRPLKDKDLIELKRAVNKLKKTTDVIDGDIAGFGDDYLVVTPAIAQIYRNKQTTVVNASEQSSAQENM